MENSDKKAFIFGGLRGLSQSLFSVFTKHSYSTTVLSRATNDHACPDANVIYIDIDQDESVEKALQCAVLELLDKPYSYVQVLLLYGGGLGVDSLSTTISNEELLRLFHHNLLIQHRITVFFLNHLRNNNIPSHIKFNYIFSAASQSYGADPLYVASKVALEGMMKAFVCKRINRASFSGFRLGMVDVKYKYYHKLRSTDVTTFNKIVSEKLPSTHYPTTDEVALHILRSTENYELSNGMICDISGGNSWIA